MLTEFVSQSLVRPANTTAYTAGDVWTNGSNARMVFTGLNRNTGYGAEIKHALAIDDAAQATKVDLELWLFSADITDLDADNAAWTPTDAQLATLIGIIAFPVANFKPGDATAGAGGNAACIAANVGIAIKHDTLYGVLVVRNAYTPVSAETL